MFNNINEFLGGESLELNVEGDPTDRDLQVSVLVLLAQIAQSDNEFEPEEVRSIAGHALREFGLNDSEVGELIEVARFLIQDQSKVAQFVDKLNTSFSDNQKQLILSVLWKVLLADGVVEKCEAVLVSQIRKSLNLSMEQAVRSGKLAELDKIQDLVTSFRLDSDG